METNCLAACLEAKCVSYVSAASKCKILCKKKEHSSYAYKMSSTWIKNCSKMWFICNPHKIFDPDISSEPRGNPYTQTLHNIRALYRVPPLSQAEHYFRKCV